MKTQKTLMLIAICTICYVLGIVPDVYSAMVIDNGESGFTTIGTWADSTTVPGYYGSNYQWATAGTGNEQAQWSFAIPEAGYYTVSAWWSSPYFTRASNAPYTITHAAGTTTVPVNQNLDGGQWNSLGTYYFAAGTATVVLTNQADGNPVADAVQLEAAAFAADFSATPGMGSAPLDVSFVDQSVGAVTAWQWEFGDGTSSTAANPLHRYEAAGVYTVTLTVTGEGQEAQRTKTEYIEVLNPWSEKIIDNGESGFSTIGSWPESTLVAGYYGQNYQWCYGDTGSSRATWRFSIVEAGEYAVSAWWPGSYATRSSNVPYTITHATGTTRVVVDQQSQGGRWNDLGTYSFEVGEATVTVSSDATGNPVADAVRLQRVTSQPTPTPTAAPTTTPTVEPTATPTVEPTATPTAAPTATPTVEPTATPTAAPTATPTVEPTATPTTVPTATPTAAPTATPTVEPTATPTGIPTATPTVTPTPIQNTTPMVIDNGESGFTTIGTWADSTTVPGYYGSNYQWATAGTGSEQAQWSFSIADAGYYTVSAWWSSPYFTRASNAPYTITHAAGATTVPVNQNLDGGHWNSLGTYYFAAGTATVVLTNQADGNPVADAVQLEAAAFAADFSATPGMGSAPLDVSFVDQSVGAITAWQWEFGDGTSSTAANPLHRYEAAGVYTVTLTVTGEGQEAQRTKTEYIEVLNPWSEKIIDNGESGFSTLGSWPDSTLVAGYYGQNYQWCYGDTGSSRATWRFSIVEAGEYAVSAWWPGSYATRSSNVPYTITHATGTTRVVVDQQSQGGRWNDLGTYSFEVGEATVTVSSEATGNPVADAVRLQRVTSLPTPTPTAVPTATPTSEPTATPTAVPTATPTPIQDSQVMVIDNGESGFTTIGSWAGSTTVPGYYGSNYQWATAGTGNEQAQWRFSVADAGYYTVSAWWSSPYSTRASNAPYTITHAAGATTVPVNQNLDGGHWNSLGTYYFTAGTATVVLTNQADGNPVADAVQLETSTFAADFSATPVKGVAPLDVAFLAHSVDPMIDWYWEFGDGETSTAPNPVHTYQQSGEYTVSLTAVYDGQEYSRTKVGYIKVMGSEQVAYEFIWPVAEQDFFIFQAFGNIRLEQGGYHAATDFAVYRTDAEVRNIANGWVESFDGFGNAIMMKHYLPNGDYVYSWHNHLADSPANRFRIGEFLSKGTVIGIVGETGWSPSGLHDHLEIKRTNDVHGGYISDLGQHFNPYEFIFSRLTYNPNPPDHCSDGTAINACSPTKPLRCIAGGYLVENSLICGCSSGVAQTDGTCSKTETGIIIDNTDPEFQSSGNWERTTYTMGFYGSDFLLAPAEDSASSASWTPHIPETGNYQVYGWWRDGFSAYPSSRATNAPIVINHAGQQTHLSVDFSDYYKEWKYLGTFLFEAGTGNSVELMSTLTGEVVADAFRFVWDSPPEVNTEMVMPFQTPMDIPDMQQTMDESAVFLNRRLMADSQSTPVADLDGASIPEPNTLLLLSTGLIGIFWLSRRHKNT